LSQEAFTYEMSDNNHVIPVYCNQVCFWPNSSSSFYDYDIEFLNLLELLSTITLWFIWKARCIKTFDNRRIPLEE
jgi:hypothetical protein